MTVNLTGYSVVIKPLFLHYVLGGISFLHIGVYQTIYLQYLYLK